MHKYIRENIRNLSVTLCLVLFPNLVLALPSDLNAIINKKIASMTLDEKVGQLFIVGFPQTKVDPALERFIFKYKPGSYLLFKRNIQGAEQIKALNDQLYRMSFKVSKLPPLIAIDQEGGAVSRLPIVPAPPNALAIGQTQSSLMAEEMGRVTGRFLREVGFNMNLAPVLDVSDPFSGSFIGVRSFGSDANLVRELGFAYSKGLLKARVIPTAKHFPGTGDLRADPHLRVVENRTSLNRLYTKDLLPYRGYSQLGSGVAVMLSHYIYPALDESREPASFSKKIIQEILRRDLGFKGIIITDDLQMQGSRQLLRPEAAALKALQAGADIVMLTFSFSDQGRAFDFVKKSLANGSLPARVVDEKLRRILTAKAFANLYRRDPLTPSLFQGNILTSTDYRELEATILERNLNSALLPKELPVKSRVHMRIAASVSNICLLAPTKKFLTSFKSATTKAVKSRLLVGEMRPKEVKSWVESQTCEKVLFAVTGPKTAKLTKALAPSVRDRSIVINLGSPKLFSKNIRSPRVMNLFFNHEDSGQKIAEHLDQILQSSSPNLVLRD